MLPNWEEEASEEDDAAAEGVATGAGTDEETGFVDPESIFDNCAGVLEAGSVEDSDTCEALTGFALITCFCWTATDGRDGVTSVSSVAGVGFAAASVLGDEHSEGTSSGFFHCKVPSLIPLQTSFWPTIFPLRTKATTVGPGTLTVSKTSAERLTA